MRKVPTRQAALTLVEEGHSYEEAGLRLGVPPGLAYLTATGVPADSSDGLSAGDLDRPGLLPAAQGLVNPRTEQPDRSAHVRAFLSARAGADPQMQAAAKARRTRESQWTLATPGGRCCGSSPGPTRRPAGRR